MHNFTSPFSPALPAVRSSPPHQSEYPGKFWCVKQAFQAGCERQWKGYVLRHDICNYHDRVTQHNCFFSSSLCTEMRLHLLHCLQRIDVIGSLAQSISPGALCQCEKRFKSHVPHEGGLAAQKLGQPELGPHHFGCAILYGVSTSNFAVDSLSDSHLGFRV